MIKNKLEPKAVVKEKKVNKPKLIKDRENVLTTNDDEIVDNSKNKLAKAGKRSSKATKEKEEKKAKDERKLEKASDNDLHQKPKFAIKPARSRLERRGKNFRNVAKLITAGKVYNISEALDLVTKTNPSKFDATVEIHVRLDVDPRHADQNVRDTIVLPAGSGKVVRVAVFCNDEDKAAAKKAGADIVGIAEVVQKLDKNQFDFDILISTPSLMAQLVKYARVLGPRSLMPNPKSGTVTSNIVKAVQEAKSGRLEYRVDSTGIVHVGIGKVSFGSEKLGQNAAVLFSSLKANKPSSIKSVYVKSIYATTTMGPSIAIDPTSV